MWQRWVRRGLLALSVFFASALVYIVVTKSEIGSSSQTSPPDALSHAATGMQDFKFLQSRDGVVQWEVRADRARILESDNRAVLDEVKVTLYGEDGHDLTLHGDQGTINTHTRDFVLANRSEPLVIELDGGYTIYTNHLAWANDKQEIRTEDPVMIIGNGMEVTGRGLVGDLEADEFQIQHDVHVQVAP